MDSTHADYDVVDGESHSSELTGKLRSRGAREVLFKLKYCGVCHATCISATATSISAAASALYRERGMHPPVTLGHEPFGTSSPRVLRQRKWRWCGFALSIRGPAVATVCAVAKSWIIIV